MGKTLEKIAQELKDSSKKVQLIYAFNGVGKTRLSRIFKDLVTSEQEDDEKTRSKIIYYNAFTEDLFYWDNDLEEDTNRKLKIRPNGFTRWILEDEGQGVNIITNFQRYTNDKLTPIFNSEYTIKGEDGKDIKIPAYSEITFSIERGNDETINNIKISKGEESCLIWCIFYSLLKEVIETLNIPEVEERSVDGFNELEYVFIDDPVSSLDENHLIELAIDIAELINSSLNGQLKFIITTHNPLFYNVLYNELNFKKKNKKNSPCAYMLDKNEDGTFEIDPKFGDSNKSFSYHLFLKQTIEEAIQTKSIQKYHFILLRNLYEKTASFLGYPEWSNLLPDDKLTYYNRIIQFTSHSTLSNEAIAAPTDPEKKTLELLFNHLVGDRYWKEKQ
ncbi:AAA family ATPase [Capnocytophaga ochracea]|uniref:AAA family ATPase n=1 Tax=Capnocytophaga ochracea TaxID=1018 RepID=UPI00222F0DAC|nr:AAA family ATPase [Capnocytophaga ochracea]UZD38819.1 AAA family ATPase [Capnocytophaga ochracea]